MRPGRTVTFTSTAAIAYEVGRDAYAVYIHNESPTQMVAQAAGAGMNVRGHASRLLRTYGLRNPAFDGFVTLTPQAATPGGGSVFCDIYGPDEPLPADDPGAPTRNIFGTNQDRVIALPMTPLTSPITNSGTFTGAASTQLDLFPVADASWPALNGTCRVYLYLLRLDPFFPSPDASQQFSVQIEVGAYDGGGTLISALSPLYRGTISMAKQGTTVAFVQGIDFVAGGVVPGVSLDWTGTNKVATQIRIFLHNISATAFSAGYTLIWGVDPTNADSFPSGYGEFGFSNGGAY